MDNKPTISFAGMQKMTLLDYPDKTACTLFTAGCNFACPFCHNPDLVTFINVGGAPPLLPEEDVLRFLKSRQGLLDGVCISGGEPLAHEDVLGFARRVKELGYLVKIDTNGSYPDRLRALVEDAKIDYVAMDIKNAPNKYAQTIGVTGYDAAPVLRSVEYLLAGNVPYEFRTTVVREFHALDDLLSIARLIPNAAKYYLQGFDNPERALQAGLSAYEEHEMREMLESVKEVLPRAQLRGVR